MWLCGLPSRTGSSILLLCLRPRVLVDLTAYEAYNGLTQHVRLALALASGCTSTESCHVRPPGLRAVRAPDPRRKPPQQAEGRAGKPRMHASQPQRAFRTTSAPSLRAAALSGAATPAARCCAGCFGAQAPSDFDADYSTTNRSCLGFGAVCGGLRPTRQLQGGCPRQAVRSATA